MELRTRYATKHARLPKSTDPEQPIQFHRVIFIYDGRRRETYESRPISASGRRARDSSCVPKGGEWSEQGEPSSQSLTESRTRHNLLDKGELIYLIDFELLLEECWFFSGCRWQWLRCIWHRCWLECCSTGTWARTCNIRYMKRFMVWTNWGLGRVLVELCFI